MAKKKKKVSKGKKIQVGFHQGHILMYLAEMYDSWHEVIGEMVQNLIDANARKALVHLNLVTRTLTVYDNGSGETMAGMERRIQNIGKRLKTGTKKIGHKGIGNLAPLSLKTDKSVWTMTTHKAKGKGPKGWFEVSLAADTLESPKAAFGKTDLPAGFKIEDGESRHIPGLATRVRMTNIAPTALLELDTSQDPARAICAKITERYSGKIETNHLDLRVFVVKKDKSTIQRKVEPQRFPGDKYVDTLTTPKGREVKFEFYYTQRDERKTRTYVRHNEGVQFQLHKMRRIWRDVIEVLGSGYVQGIIYVNDFCTLTAKRQSFKDDADLEDFHHVLLEYTIDYALPRLEDARENAQKKVTNAVLKDVVEKVGDFLMSRKDLQVPFLSAAKGDVGHPTDGDAIYVADKPDKTPKKTTKIGGEIGRKLGRGPTTGGAVARHIKEIDILKHKSGMVVMLIEADPNDRLGLDWQSQLVEEGKRKGVILINSSHARWKSTEKQGVSALHTHACLLVMKELTIGIEGASTKAVAFDHIFDTKFLEFRELLYPRIHRGAKDKKKAK